MTTAAPSTVGRFTIEDDHEREISEADTLSAAMLAVRTHLVDDGEDGPLHIVLTLADGIRVEQSARAELVDGRLRWSRVHREENAA